MTPTLVTPLFMIVAHENLGNAENLATGEKLKDPRSVKHSADLLTQTNHCQRKMVMIHLMLIRRCG